MCEGDFSLKRKELLPAENIWFLTQKRLELAGCGYSLFACLPPAPLTTLHPVSLAQNM